MVFIGRAPARWAAQVLVEIAQSHHWIIIADRNPCVRSVAHWPPYIHSKEGLALMFGKVPSNFVVRGQAGVGGLGLGGRVSPRSGSGRVNDFDGDRFTTKANLERNEWYSLVVPQPCSWRLPNRTTG